MYCRSALCQSKILSCGVVLVVEVTQNGLGTEHLVIETALMGILQDFSDLPHQCQAPADIELIAELA